MSDKEKLIGSVADAVEKIGNAKWKSVIAFALMGVTVFTMYENRALLFEQVLNNPVVGISIGVLLAASTIAGATLYAFRIYHEQQEKILVFYRERHSNMERKIEDLTAKLISVLSGRTIEFRDLDDVPRSEKDIAADEKDNSNGK